MTNYRRTNGLSRAVRIAGAAAATTVATGLFSTGAANADVFVPLPDGQKYGPGVTLTHVGERALISPSLAANGAGRVVWVTGNAIADVSVTPEGVIGPTNGPGNAPGTNNSSTHGVSQISTGYVVGCQVSIADDAISAGVSGGVNVSGASLGGSIGLQLGPGEVRFVSLDYKDILKPGVYAVEYQDAEIQVQGCAGYAQARSYTVVEIIGDDYSKTTLYGMPFSIG
ncbi:MspA family porin [Nocardia sp. NPDC049190]|uniref:MspA family porin n=1 Tax=Nocardia sp. NPDC049190 TaxID=3155650 RepID=UPI0033D4D588